MTQIRLFFRAQVLAGGHDVVSGRIEPTNTAECGSFDVERTEATKRQTMQPRNADLCRKLYWKVSGNTEQMQTQNLDGLYLN